MAIDCLVLGKSLSSSLYASSSFTIYGILMFYLYSGAGQEIGKSCVVVTINGKRIMFDCGMHMGCDDHNRYPDFSLVSKSGDFDNAISCIIITHLY